MKIIFILKKWLSIGIIVLIGFLVLLYEYQHSKSKDDTPLHKDSIYDAMTQSANYLANSVKESGMFEYRINMDPSIKVKKRYNILRHAGTIYSMSMYHQLYPDTISYIRKVVQPGAS